MVPQLPYYHILYIIIFLTIVQAFPYQRVDNICNLQRVCISKLVVEKGLYAPIRRIETKIRCLYTYV